MLKVVGIIYIVWSVILIIAAIWIHFKGEVNDDE